MSHTRAHLLKTALVGAALTLPFATPARSAETSAAVDCQKPCFFTAKKKFDIRAGRCAASTTAQHVYNTWLWTGTPYLFMFNFGVAEIAYKGCVDLAVLLNKGDAWDCTQPGCSGYDPKGPSGPCENNPGPCCPCSGCESGYTPCSPGLCCNKAGTGCGYGSDCGG